MSSREIWGIFFLNVLKIKKKVSKSFEVRQFSLSETSAPNVCQKVRPNQIFGRSLIIMNYDIRKYTYLISCRVCYAKHKCNFYHNCLWQEFCYGLLTCQMNFYQTYTWRFARNCNSWIVRCWVWLLIVIEDKILFILLGWLFTSSLNHKIVIWWGEGFFRLSAPMCTGMAWHIPTRVLALLKNNNDNALSLLFKMGNE